MIEPIWPKLKRRTTRKGAPKSGKEAEAVWRKEWQDFEQSRLQAFVERIPWHIQQVIRCKGGNEYIEGRDKRAAREFLRLCGAYGAYGCWAGDKNTIKVEGDDTSEQEFKRLVRTAAVRFVSVENWSLIG
jgi:hypothetical protein